MKEAAKVIKNPSQISLLNLRVKELCERKAECIDSVWKEIQDLMKFTASAAAGKPTDRGAVQKALAALLYLLNPYDSIYDRFPDFGFSDDIALAGSDAILVDVLFDNPVVVEQKCVESNGCLVIRNLDRRAPIVRPLPVFTTALINYRKT